MPNEFIIKNGFQSKGNSIVEGSLTVTSISATTYQGVSTITGGTFNTTTETLTLNNSAGGSINVTGVTTDQLQMTLNSQVYS